MSILLNELHNRRERLATLCGELRGAAERADYDDVFRLAFDVATLAESIVEKTARVRGEWVQVPLFEEVRDAAA